MYTTRRTFTGGALSLAFASTGSIGLAASSPSQMADALEAIGHYADAHLRYYNLPNMTLSVTTPEGFSTTINRGYASLEGPRPIAPDTLFQIGSITKSVTAAIIHQLAAEGRLDLYGDARPLLADAPWPDAMITIQQLLDHVSGLPDDGPTHLSAGRLWVGYKPGEHWWYSNVGYVLLGRIAERAGKAPLQRLIQGRILSPLGMTHSRGYVTSADRLRSAQGYEPVDRSSQYVRGTALRPAPWMEISDGAGCVASTAADMSLYLRSLSGAASGRGGLGLSRQEGRAFTNHFVPSGEGNMRYGNGLMEVAEAGVTYLHHTGGGPFGSAAFHLDPKSGLGAFACSTISGFADYRPRKLTLFAIQALSAVRAGRPLPPPPEVETAPANMASFAGAYHAGMRTFNVRGERSAIIAANGREAPLHYWDDDLFHTSHPDFSDFAIQFERSGNQVVGANWGAVSFVRDGAGVSTAKSNPVLALLAGRFVNDGPYAGVVRIVERAGRLWLGTETPLVRLNDTLWRVGKEDWSPERAEFGDFVERRPQTVKMSGTTFERREL